MTDFSPRRDVYAISHINVVVDDIEVATEFYRTVLGFDQAVNADGPMNYPGVDLASFARNAGFDDDRVSLDIRFLKHAEVGLYLELFNYRHPKGEQTVHRRKTNDLGGIRHVALEVPDAAAADAFISCVCTGWTTMARSGWAMPAASRVIGKFEVELHSGTSAPIAASMSR